MIYNTLILFILLGNVTHFEDSVSVRHNTIGISYGSNYYGHTYGISYEHIFSPKWSTAIGFTKGVFAYEHKAHSTWFFYKYDGEDDLSIKFHFNSVLDFILFRNRPTESALCFFPKYGFGLSHYYVVLEESMIYGVTGWEFRGEKKYINLAVLFAADIIKFRPGRSKTFALTIGGKVNYTILNLPHEVILYYNNVQYPMWMDNSLGFLSIIYPQIVANLQFSF